MWAKYRQTIVSSVADPDPYDLNVFVLPEPDPFPLVRGTNLDPSIINQNSKKNLDSYWFVTSDDFLSLKNYANVASKGNKQKHF